MSEIWREQIKHYIKNTDYRVTGQKYLHYNIIALL